MIKGVNKRIVEINNPDSIYFDRAVFYLKPCVREFPATVAASEAEKYIQLIGAGSDFGFVRKKKRRFLLFSLLSLALSVFGLMIYFL